MNMKDNLRKTWKLAKRSLNRFASFGRAHWALCACLFLCELLTVFGASLAVAPFDGQAVSEITQRLTAKAENSPLGYTMSSVTMEEVGNSDCFVYTDSELQNFQMRNHHYEDTKDYVFAAYQPKGSFTPFELTGTSSIQCSTILFQSKYNGTDFFFDLPTLAGSFHRYNEKKTVVLMDTLANKILDEGKSYPSLLGKTIEGKSITRSGQSTETFTIGAVVGSESDFGSLLLATFGEDILFVPDYNLFQMVGSLYFCASTNRAENKAMVEFVLGKYRSYFGTSRDLQIGHNAKYAFYDYDASENVLVLGDDNTRMNGILTFYNGSWPIILAVVGIVLIVTGFVLTILVSFRFRRGYCYGYGQCLAWIWTSSCLALLVNSLLYRFISVPSLASGTLFAGFSPIGSTVMILVWLFVVGLLTFSSLRRYKRFMCDMGAVAAKNK